MPIARDWHATWPRVSHASSAGPSSSPVGKRTGRSFRSSCRSRPGNRAPRSPSRPSSATSRAARRERSSCDTMPRSSRRPTRSSKHSHGTRPNEARSDIFFLEVKPYEQEFALAQSQGGMPGGGQNGIDDLVNAQKEIVVATWKLDRRARSTKGARSEQDIQSVARAEAKRKTRVEQTSSPFRESTMRDPRRRQPQRGRGGQPPPSPTPEL